MAPEIWGDRSGTKQVDNRALGLPTPAENMDENGVAVNQGAELGLVITAHGSMKNFYTNSTRLTVDSGDMDTGV